MNESLQANLLKAIRLRISSAVSDIQWITQDLGQLDYFDLHPAVSFPCTLIDFTRTSFDTEGSLSLWGDISIVIRLAFAPYDDSDTATDVQTKALSYWEIENKLYQALHNWQPVNENGEILCNPLLLNNCTTEKRDNDYLLQLYFLKDAAQRRENAIRVRNIVFSTSFEEENTNISHSLLPDVPTFEL